MISTHERLIALLDEQKANFRIVEHKPEGRSEQISKIRGNEPNQAMKAIVVSVRGGGGGKRYALAVLPGIRRLDMKSLCKAMGAQKGKFATTRRGYQNNWLCDGRSTPVQL